MALAHRSRRTRLLVIVLVLASLFTITLDYRGGQSGPLEAAGRATLSVVGPMQDAVSNVLHPVGEFFSGLAHAGSLQSENQRLKAELQAAQTQIGQVTYLRGQVLQLQQLLHMQNRLNLSGVAAQVIAQSPSNFENVVTISAGSSQGVADGMAVVAGDGLVGHVVNVGATTSQVLLIIDPTSSVAGRLVNTGDTGLVVGNRSQDLLMKLVPPDTKVQPAEQVVTAGFQGSLYPPGILIGYVSRESTNPADLSKTIDVRPAVDFSSLQYVLVLGAHSAG